MRKSLLIKKIKQRISKHSDEQHVHPPLTTGSDAQPKIRELNIRIEEDEWLLKLLEEKDK